MDLSTVKFVRIFPKLPNGKFETVNIPITSPQKIRAYIDMGDLQPKNFLNNDHGWRLDPEITAQIRDILDDPTKLEQIARETGRPLDLLNAFHVFMYEMSRNRKLAVKAQANSLDKANAMSEYEQEVAKAREKAETVPEPSTSNNFTPKVK